jgi:hypothetical protein
MVRKHILVIFIVVGSVSGVLAQGDMTLYSLRGLQQSTYLNPAFMPDYDLSVGVPVLSNLFVGAQVSGFDMNTVKSSIDATNYLDIGSLYSNMNSNVFGVKAFVQTDIFHYRQQFGHYQVSLYSGMRTNGQVLLSKEFIGFPAYGNGNFAGQTLHFDGNSIQLSSYVETGLGVAREFERFTVGARVKLLNGIVNLSTQNLALNYSTGSPSYNSTRITTGGTLNTSGLPFLQDTLNGVPNPDKDFKTSNVNPADNIGFAVDLGATYYVTPRLNVHAAAIDLGYINWKSHPYNYDLSNMDISLVGMAVNQIRYDSLRSKYSDSLQTIVKNVLKSKTTMNAYSIPLVSRFVAGADYDLSLRDRVGAIVQVRYFDGMFFPSYTLTYSRKVGSNWNIATNYSYYNNSFVNLGLGTSVKWGAFQLYFIQDDILFYFLPASGRTVYLRFGCNLVWGAQRGRARY